MIEDNRKESIDPSLDGISEQFNARAHSIDPTPRPGFKEALLLRLHEARRASRMSRISFTSFTDASRRQFAFASVPALAVLVIAVLVFQPFFGVQTVYAFDQFTLTPEVSDALGVDPNTSYLLESRTEVDLNAVRDDLVIATESATASKIETISDRSLRITFEEPLAPEELVQVNLNTQATWPNGESVPRTYNWAFQVKGTFRVTGAIPGNHTQGVPLESGFEFQLSFDNVDPDAFERALTITPAVKGHVEHSRRSFVFVPEEPLLPSTVYRVVLSKDLPLVGSEATLGADYEIEFETAATSDVGIGFGVEHYLTTSPGHQVYTETWRWVEDPAKDVPVHAKVYRLPDFDTYVSMLRQARDGMEWRGFSTADELIGDASYPVAFEVDPLFSQPTWQGYLVFPEPFEEGYYLIDYSMSGARDWSLVASSNVTAYVSRAVDQTLVWANDAGSGNPIEGATVVYDGDSSAAQTNASGLGSIPAKEEQSDLVLVTKGEAGIALALDGRYWIMDGKGGGRAGWNRSSGTEPGSSSDHWSYVYTDRPMYQPTDTVKVWGYVESREDGSRPETVRVWLGGNTETGVPTDTLDETDVPVTSNGTFLAELSIKRATPNSYQVGVAIPTAEDAWLAVATRQITVSEYVKPAYTLSVELDKDAAYWGDDVSFTVHGAFYEGTPVKGLDVHVTMGCYDQVLKLDGAGNASGTYRLPQSEQECGNFYFGSSPGHMGIDVAPNRPEEGMITASDSVRVFGPKIYLDVENEKSFVKNGTGTLSLLVRNTQAIDSYDAKVFGPTTRAGQTVTGYVTEVTQEKKETGTYYDFIRKVTVQQWEYERHEKNIGSFSVVSNADGRAVYTFPATVENALYEIEVKGRDELGRVDTRRAWIYEDEEDRSPSDENLNLQWKNDDEPEKDPWTFPGYDIGQEVHLSVLQNQKPYVAAAGDHFLFYKAQQGIRETFIVDEGRVVFPFKEQDVPDVTVYGVLFTRGAYLEVGNGWSGNGSGIDVSLNQKLRELTVKVTPEKDAYAPGSEAVLNVEVVDKDGKPAQAEVNLNVVDEAFYTLMAETVDPLGMLYRRLDSGIITTKVSAELKSLSAGAEGGGGGGDRGRVEFKDTAVFTTVQTGKNGKAEVTIKLPDNITQWRVTAQALDVDGKRAGFVTAPVNASLPFFLVPVLRETYLDADKPTMLVRAAGTDVGSQDMVEYEIRIPDADYKERRAVVVGETLRVELPDLALGVHEITIEGKTGKFEDTITRSVTILESRIVKPVISSVLLSGSDQSISGATDGMTTISFVDGGRGRYFGELESLAGSGGERIDEQMARFVSTNLLNEYFSAGREVAEIPVSIYQAGGIRLLAYSDPEFDLAAKMALFGEDSPFFAQDLVSYFSSQLDQNAIALTPLETAEGLAALAALGEPVLSELQRVSAQPPEDVGVRLWLALGLHAAGDDESARVLYRALVQGAKTINGYTYLEGSDQETTSEWTALLTVLAGTLGEPERDALYDYVTDKFAGNTLLTIDRALFLNETLPMIPTQNATVAYTLEGSRHSETLDATQAMFSLVVDPEELAGLDLAITEGKALAVSRYQTPLVDPTAPVSDVLALRRSYANDAGVTTDLSEGDLVKISVAYTLPSTTCGWSKQQDAAVSPLLSVDEITEAVGITEPGSYIPCETYEITDVIPSGLSLVSPSYDPYMWDVPKCVSFPVSVVEGRATFFVTQDTSSGCDGEPHLEYYARVVTPGQYEAEPAYIRSTRDPETNNHSSSETITIHE